MRAFLPPITGPEAGKTSAIADGIINAKIVAPSRILRLTEYINSSGTVSYTRKRGDERNKISGIGGRGRHGGGGPENVGTYRVDAWNFVITCFHDPHFRSAGHRDRGDDGGIGGGSITSKRIRRTRFVRHRAANIE